MMCFGLGPVDGDRVIRSTRSELRDGTELIGSVVAVRPIWRGLQVWEHLPRQMAVVALDNGQWCFAWIVDGLARLDARVRYMSRAAGEKYPEFTPIREPSVKACPAVGSMFSWRLPPAP